MLFLRAIGAGLIAGALAITLLVAGASLPRQDLWIMTGIGLAAAGLFLLAL